MRFSRQEYWSGLPCLPPGDLPNPGTEAGSPSLQADSLLLSHQGSPLLDWQYLIWFNCSKHRRNFKSKLPSVQFSSVAQLYPILCNPMNRSTPGLPVHHQLPELAQTHVHQVGDAIQLSHSLLSPSPPAFNLSQHQGLFLCISSLHQLAQVLALQLQHQSFQWLFRTDFLQDGLVWSPCCPRDSQESSPTPLFKGINSSVLSFIYGATLTSIHDYWKNHSFDYMDIFQ